MIDSSSVYKPLSVHAEPSTKLTQWRAIRATNDGLATIHLVGWTGYEGRVTSAIQDNTGRVAITQSGRTYTLVGKSGFNNDAMHVLGVWKDRFPMESRFEDITDEYLT